MIIREVSFLDSDEIFNWRNDINTRLMAKDFNKIDKKTHNKWFENCILNNNYELFLGMLDGVKVGVVWFISDLKKKTAEVSINLNPSERGKNLSFILLKKSIDKFLEINNFTLHSTVKKKNLLSKTIFQKCNFKIKKSDKLYVYFFLETN